MSLVTLRALRIRTVFGQTESSRGRCSHSIAAVEFPRASANRDIERSIEASRLRKAARETQYIACPGCAQTRLTKKSFWKHVKECCPDVIRNASEEVICTCLECCCGPSLAVMCSQMHPLHTVPRANRGEKKLVINAPLNDPHLHVFTVQLTEGCRNGKLHFRSRCNHHPYLYSSRRQRNCNQRLNSRPCSMLFANMMTVVLDCASLLRRSHLL